MVRRFIFLTGMMGALAAPASTTYAADPGQTHNNKAGEERHFTPDCQPVATGGLRSQWRYGLLSARQCQIDMIRTRAAEAADLKYEEVSRRAAEIRWYYQARAGRQQRWLDWNTGATVGGGAGYLASAGAGAATQGYWGALALTPILLAQFNAYEPTRDLFHGASIGVDLISIRYARLNRSIAMLEAYRTPDGASDAGWRTACAALKIQLGIAGGWTANRPDKNAIVPDLQKLSKACGELDSQEDYHGALLSAGKAWKAQTPYLYANDVLAFDELVVHRDHDLRFTPLEALTSIAAAPFQTASTLLTGENGKKAIDGLKTQAAFASLDLQLSEIVLPPALTTSEAMSVGLSPTAAARRDVDERTKDDPEFAAVVAALQSAEAAASAINDARARQAFASVWVLSIRQAAAADRMSFNYDATKGTISISLGPLPTSPAPLAQVGAPSKP